MKLKFNFKKECRILHISFRNLFSMAWNTEMVVNDNDLKVWQGICYYHSFLGRMFKSNLIGLFIHFFIVVVHIQNCKNTATVYKNCKIKKFSSFVVPFNQKPYLKASTICDRYHAARYSEKYRFCFNTAYNSPPGATSSIR